MQEINTRSYLADAKFYESYSRFIEDEGRYEKWEESVSRVMDMHRQFYADKMTPELSNLIDFTQQAYNNKEILGSQRALQFGGEQLLRHHLKLYNCLSSYADRPEFFGEIMYALLCGCGAGFSVQKQHVDKIPHVAPRKKQPKVHIIEDSIEGWAKAADVLLSSYFVGGGKHPEFEGRKVFYDSSLIRKKGAKISGGFKAPGPEPLIKALNHMENILNERAQIGFLRTIDVYDIVMHLADAVIAGGVRRSATICLFSHDDEDMLTAKTGNWFVENPQRGRSNNSVVILRSTATFEMFQRIMKSVIEFGEPGFIFVDSLDHAFNPCVEIGMLPHFDGVSGWQGCNLVEQNGSKATSKVKFMDMCKAAAILGTLQAGYTDFNFMSETTKKIFDREALLGVSITGWMSQPDILLNEETQREGAELVKATNVYVAGLIGINPAARTTCVKPSGNASVLLMTPSATSGEHSPRYIRHAQMNKDSEVAKLIAKTNPYMVEDSVWSTSGTDYAVAFPTIVDKDTVKFKTELKGVDFLKTVQSIQQNWIEYGTNLEFCVDKTLRHNVSNTVTVPAGGWDEVTEYLFNNRQYFAGISFIADTGDKDYAQAPFTEVLTADEIASKYGIASFFASGLIVDATRGFSNLWEAISAAQWGYEPGSQETIDQKENWIRRFKKFSKNYFNGDDTETSYCLKNVQVAYKWEKIQQNFVPIDFNAIKTQEFTDIDTTGAIACFSGQCEL